MPVSRNVAAAPRMDLEPSPPLPAPRNPRWKTWTAMISLPILAAAGWLLWPGGKARPSVAAVRTVRVARGSLQSTLRVVGTVAAREFATVAAPRLQGPDTGRGLVLVEMAEPGATVSKGQVVARIDGQSIADHLVDVESQLAQAELNVAGLKARQAAEFERLRQSLRSAMADLARAATDFRAAEVKTPIEQALLKLRMEEETAISGELAEELNTLDDRQQSQLRVAELDRERQLRHHGRHVTDLERMTVRAPISGHVVVRTAYRNGQTRQVRVGDELHPGQPFLRIVDPSSMSVEAAMNQVESELVRTGQPARLRFDAYPGLVLDGKVEAVGALAAGGRQTDFYIRTIPVRIAIEGSDPRIISDLTASADVVVSEETDALLAPREAIVESGGRSVVWVRQGEAFVERAVQVGAQNNTHAAVTGGLAEGEEIALQPPSEHDNPSERGQI